MENRQPPPVGIVIAAHGDLARALRDSAEMIVGAHDDVVTVSLEPQDNLETCQAALSAAIDTADRGAGAIVLVDLFGGTPSNAAALCLRQRRSEIVSGVNLPMLLEVLLRRSGLTAEALATLASESGVKGIVDVAARMRAEM